MVKCPTCSSPRKATDAACPRCGVGRDAPTDEVLPVLRTEQTRDAARPARGSPFAEESLAGVHVDVRPRLEFATVPAGCDPMAGLLVDVTPHGPPLLDPTAGPVAHVVLALDVSASMDDPDKYPVLAQALGGLLADLARPGTHELLLSVVVFAYGAEVLFRDARASSLVPADVLAQVEASPLLFGRYTDVAGGLERAARVALDQLRVNKGMPTRIYLLTDGRPQDVARARAAMAKVARLPVDVDALAFGDDADVGLLLELVSGGRGGTVKQVRADTLGDAFDRIAEVARRIVANRAVLELELAPGVVGSEAFRYRPGRHPFGEQAFAGGTVFRADLGTLESGRTYSTFFDVRLPESAEGTTKVGTVTLRIPGRGGARVFGAEVAVERRAGVAMPAPDPDVAAARDVLHALTVEDPRSQLRALRVRRRLYQAERRDPLVLAVIDKAISLLESGGSLASLSPAELATLRAHTATVTFPVPRARAPRPQLVAS